MVLAIDTYYIMYHQSELQHHAEENESTVHKGDSYTLYCNTYNEHLYIYQILWHKLYVRNVHHDNDVTNVMILYTILT